MDPITLGLGLVSGIGAIAGRRPKAKGVPLGEYDRAISRANIGDFSYDPNRDLNDPELLLRRGRLNRSASERRSRTTDEIGRAGLLGSGRSFDIMRGVENDYGKQLEDLDSDIFARRRSEALGMHQDELGFRRNLELERLRGLGGQASSQYANDAAQYGVNMGNLGSIIEFLSSKYGGPNASEPGFRYQYLDDDNPWGGSVPVGG